MCKIEEAKEKLNRAKEKVESDLSNGRHKQKRIKAKVKKLGLTEKSVVEEINKIVSGK